jgi:hypothetical protein
MNPGTSFSLACKLIGVSIGVRTLLTMPIILLMPISGYPGKGILNLTAFSLIGSILSLIVSWVFIRYADAFARRFVTESAISPPNERTLGASGWLSGSLVCSASSIRCRRYLVTGLLVS